MSNIEDEIRAKTEAFANDLAVLVRRVALESVSAVLGGATVAAPARAAAKRGPGRPKKATFRGAGSRRLRSGGPGGRRSRRSGALPPRPPPLPRRAGPRRRPWRRSPLSAKRPAGAKRPPAELAKLTEKLGEYIKGHPGLRIEPIGKALSIPTKELTLPVKKLLAAKKIRSEGQKRATEYFPA